MEFDFGNLKVPGKQTNETDPRAILRSLPVRSGAINDLWDGQAQALTQWNGHRTRSDNLILLNTGAGKTIVGLLIAESLRRELTGNVVYLCPNNDLVTQVGKEADRLGLEHTLRMGGQWSNDLYERGKALCITNYHSLLNPQSQQFRGEKTPNALILDDAHVAEGVIRDQFTLRLTLKDHPDLFREIGRMIVADEKDGGWQAKLVQTFQGAGSYSTLMASPLFGARSSTQLNTLFQPHLKSPDRSLAISLALLYGKWQFCSFVVSHNAIEIAPPALPTLSYGFFADPGVRRVYLSATLEQTVDFARAFGRQIVDPIKPQVDAGNGERVILFSEQLGGEPEEPKIVEDAAKQHNVLLAVPSHPQAERWKGLATPPEPSKFSFELDLFRSAKTGVFVLVGRYDGIDLPNETCRVMAIDGVPRGTNLLERFCWEYLNLQGELRSRIATRVTQLFGRIIRGRVDHGAFLVLSRALNNWLGDDRNIALLPELLRNQVKLGHHVHSTLKVDTPDKAVGLINSVLARAEGWVQFYAKWASSFGVDDDVVTKSLEQQETIAKLAASWVRLWSSYWTGEAFKTIDDQRQELENLLPSLSLADYRAAGWLNVWLGTTYAWEGQEANAADHFGRARSRLKAELPLPRARIEITGGLKEEDVAPMGRHFMELFRGGNVQANNRLVKEDAALSSIVDPKASPTAFEEAIRQFGECLGFESSRPDNELGKGPDVLWRSSAENSVLGLEAKSDKTTPSYNKKDIGQAHQHVVWMAETYKSHAQLGVGLVGDPKGATADSSPSAGMFAIERSRLIQLVAEYKDLRSSVRSDLGASRLAQIARLGSEDEWTLDAVFNRLAPIPLS